MMKIFGKIYDGTSSIANKANIAVDSFDSITLNVEGKLHTLSKEQLRISSRLGSSARYIEIDSFGRFETLDNDQVDELSTFIHPENTQGLLHKLESNLPLILVSIFVTISFVWALIRWGIPGAADYIVDALPEQTTSAIENSLLDKLEEDWFKPSKLSESRQQELQSLFQRVTLQLASQNDLKRTEKVYQFKLRDAEHSIGANALAFPSGTIVMTDQLVKLVNNDIQLAGVIAHEIGHLDGQHSLRQIVRGSLLTFLVAWITGDISGASSTLVTAPAILTQLKYARDFETEADHYAVEYLNCSSENLEMMAHFFEVLGGHTNKPENHQSERLEENDDILGSDFIASHPATKLRVKFFRQYHQKHCLN